MAEAELCREALGLSYGQALALNVFVALAGGIYLCLAGHLLASGVGRLAVAAPLVAVNLLVPKLFCRYVDAVTLLAMIFNLGWLCSFKAISWALNRGALCMLRFTPAQFVAVYLTPVTPAATDDQVVAPASAAAPSDSTSQASRPGLRRRAGATINAKLGSGSGSGASLAGTNSSKVGGGATLPRRGSQGRLNEDAGGWEVQAAKWGAKLAFIALIVVVLQYPLPGLLESFAYGMALYGLLSALMDGPAAVVVGLTGLRVSPHFDRPWRSTSIASFWSKRWDLAAGNTLRQLVYDTICDGSLLPPPPGAQQPLGPLRQALSTAASFLASGLIHEGIFWYLTGRFTGGQWLAFFAVQAPLIVGERLALAALKQRGVHLPDWLRNAVAALAIITTGQLLFWPPCKRHGVVDSCVGNTRSFLLAAVARLCGVAISRDSSNFAPTLAMAPRLGPAALLGLTYPEALILAVATVTSSGAAMHVAGRRLAPGRARVLPALAAVAVNLLTPLLFRRWESTITIILVSFNFAWLSSFKALSWALGRGALCAQRYTAAQFMLLYAAPLTPVAASDGAAPAGAAPAAAVTAAPAASTKAAPEPAGPSPASSQPAASAGSAGAAPAVQQDVEQHKRAAAQQQQQAESEQAARRGGRFAEDAGGGVAMARNWTAKVAFIALLVWLLLHPLPGPLRAFAYGLALYALLSLIMDGPAVLLIGATGLRVSPHFDRPWRAKGVAAFWSKHWDLAAGNTLRQLLYDPICEGSLLPLPPGAPHTRPGALRQLAATTAVFGSSGLVHEGIFWHLTGHTTGGVWCSFFLVQVAFIAIERLALGALKRRGVLLPAWLRTLVTVGLEVVASQHLFWGPCDRYGVTQSAIHNVYDALVWTARGAQAAVLQAAAARA